MATIANQQQQNNTGTNLNAGMNSSPQGQQPSVGGGAVTSTGASVSGQGGGNAAAGTNAPKQQSSGQFTNFQNYAQNNQQAAGRLNNVLNTSVNQQGQQIQDTTANTTNQAKTSVQAENDRISQGLQNVNNAQSTGNYSNFLNNTPGQSTTQQGLADWAQKLSTGATTQADIQNQFNTGVSNAQGMQNNLQQQQQLLGSGSGVNTLLNNLLGSSGTYGRGAGALDQALVVGNSNSYNNLLSNAAQQVQQGQQGLTGAQTDVTGQLSALGQNALQAQQTAQGQATAGLDALNTTLQNSAATTEQQKQNAQLAMLNEFNTGTFDANTAAALGLGQDTTMFNMLQGNNQNYNITDASKLGTYANSPYLSLDQSNITKQNMINQGQLEQYAAQQKMLGNNNQTNNYEYSDVGKGPGNYLDVNAGQFQKDLSSLYNQRADQAAQDRITGHGDYQYTHGLFHDQVDRRSADVNKAVSDMIDPNQLRQMANQFGTVGTQHMTLGNDGISTGTSDAMRGFSGSGAVQGAASGAMKAGVPGAVVGGVVGGIGGSIMQSINSLGDRMWGNNDGDAAQNHANAVAASQAQGNWNNYLQNQGYNNQAQIAATPAAFQGLTPGMNNFIKGLGV